MAEKTKTAIDRDTPVKDLIMGSGKIKRHRPETETLPRIDWSGDIMEISTDSSVPTGDVDEQITLNEARMREIISVPIETDEVSEHTSHNTPDQGGEVPVCATVSNVGDGTVEPGAPTPADRNDGRAERPAISNAGIGGKVGTASTESPTPTEDGETREPSEQTTLTVSTEPSEIPVPTPQTVAIASTATLRPRYRMQTLALSSTPIPLAAP